MAGRHGFKSRYPVGGVITYGSGFVKIKYLVCASGTGFVRNAGDVVDVEDGEAGRMIDAGYAELAVPAPVVADEPELPVTAKPIKKAK